jgi:hypothetical protein
MQFWYAPTIPVISVNDIIESVIYNGKMSIENKKIISICFSPTLTVRIAWIKIQSKIMQDLAIGW